MFDKIKRKIKIAKISGIVIALLFVLMLVSNIYLNVKVVELKNDIEKIENK